MLPDGDTTRPFSVLGLQQIAIGGLDRQRLRAFWVDALGLSAIGTFKSASENVDEELLQLGSGARAIELDLMQPLDPHGRPRVHEPPLNHIGLWVDDLEAAYAWLRARGVRFTPGGIRRGASGHDVCFVHPKDGPDGQGACGVLVELVQAPAELCAEVSAARSP